MSNEVVIVFTAKSKERILREGGTSSWRLDRNHARRCLFAVCTRNANADWCEGTEEHQSAFLIGKVRDVVPSPDHEGRYLILFSEYAEVSVSKIWKGDRNPYRYSTLDDIEINMSALEWLPMPEKEPQVAPAIQAPASTNNAPLSLADAKKGLALTFGVLPEAIEITIRG